MFNYIDAIFYFILTCVVLLCLHEDSSRENPTLLLGSMGDWSLQDDSPSNPINLKFTRQEPSSHRASILSKVGDLQDGASHSVADWRPSGNGPSLRYNCSECNINCHHKLKSTMRILAQISLSTLPPRHLNHPIFFYQPWSQAISAKVYVVLVFGFRAASHRANHDGNSRIGGSRPAKIGSLAILGDLGRICHPWAAAEEVSHRGGDRGYRGYRG